MVKTVICILLALASCVCGFVGCVVSPTRVRNLPIHTRFDRGLSGEAWWLNECMRHTWAIEKNIELTVLVADGWILLGHVTNNPERSSIVPQRLMYEGLGFESFWQPSEFQPQLDQWGGAIDMNPIAQRWPSRHIRRLAVPLWLPMLVFGIWPLIVFARKLSRDQLRRTGQACFSCSYDLRGNESGRCPECGVVVSSKDEKLAQTDST